MNKQVENILLRMGYRIDKQAVIVDSKRFDGDQLSKNSLYLYVTKAQLSGTDVDLFKGDHFIGYASL